MWDSCKGYWAGLYSVNENAVKYDRGVSSFFPVSAGCRGEAGVCSGSITFQHLYEPDVGQRCGAVIVRHLLATTGLLT